MDNMKPRLEVLQHTPEDWDIWCDLRARMQLADLPWLRMIDGYEAADRRDADLMFDSMSFNWTPETGKCTWWGGQIIDVGGAALGKGLRR
jgi:hypothetical protein